VTAVQVTKGSDPILAPPAPPLRVSATTLEAFRLYMQPEQEWMSEEALLDTIRGVFTPNRAIKIGLAFGRIVATPGRYQVPGGYACDGFTFDHGTMRPVFELIDARGVFEAKAEKTYGDVVVVSKADHLLGAHLSEFKTTEGTFDFDKYAASMQWRFMVDAFQPALVTYRIFRVYDHENGVIEVTDIDNFHLFPYAALHTDCATLVEAFVDYVRRKDGLEAELRAKQARFGGAGVMALQT
jgi:hypothetical protein